MISVTPMFVPGSPEWVHHGGERVLYVSVSVMCQTFVFGIFAFLFPFSVYIVRNRGKGMRKANWLLFCNGFMFALSVAYWVNSVVLLYLDIHAYLLEPSQPLLNKLAVYASLGNAVIMINYLIADGVVVWRAWSICSDDAGPWIYLPVFFLTLSSLSVFATIIIRVTLTAVRALHGNGPEPPRMTRAINITQIAGLSLTLITNLLATAFIGVKAWRHRVEMKKGMNIAMNKGQGTEAVLGLVVESGLIYCFLTVTAIITSLIRLPMGSLGTVYIPAIVHLVGMYPTVVLLIVEMNKTLHQITETIESTIAFRTPYATETAQRGTALVEVLALQDRRSVDTGRTSLGKPVPTASDTRKRSRSLA